MTFSRRGDPSQKSGAIRGPFRSLVLSETPFDPPPALSTQLLVSTLPWMKETSFSGVALGRLQLPDIRLQRFDDGSMGSATPLEVRKTIAPLRNDPAELGIALHAPFSICRILLRQMAKYILPREDNHFLAMHSTVSLSRVLPLERGRQRGSHCRHCSRSQVTWTNCDLGNFGKRAFDGLQLPHQHLPLQ